MPDVRLMEETMGRFVQSGEREITPIQEQLRQEREAREQAERERDELHLALHRLWLEAKCHAGISKHLMRECEAAGRLVGTRTGHKDGQ